MKSDEDLWRSTPHAHLDAQQSSAEADRLDGDDRLRILRAIELGRKIEKTMRYIDKGHGIALVSERQWTAALEASPV